ncbi:MAG: DNA-protecting protein DprA [Candidatus Daviesbacteria bacterium]|nr:MAG: DNA-protecting protein DprA [Candidatus Daviesbacteria bacterium]
MNNVAYLLVLHSVDGLGPVRLKKVLDHFGQARNAWEAKGSELLGMGIPQNTVEKFLATRKNLDPEKYLTSVQKSGIKWKTIFDEDYPYLLKQIYDPPILFYYWGEFTAADRKAIAVVGTRKMTGYGKLVTERFTENLVLAGLTIVSGLARGVDSIAHRTALKNGGRTIAVLGGGFNKIFPPENDKLAKEIAEGHGVVLSEFPPDCPSVAGNFPARNRIISGLTQATLVTEAAVDSGSLITARLALEQGREVFAVPGPITSELSRGPLDLIKEGARPIFEPSEILEELGITGKAQSPVEITDLTEVEKQILNILQNDQKHIDEICQILGVPVAGISGELLKMEIKGLIRNLGAGIYCGN